MKLLTSLILATVTMFSLHAMAVNANSSWSEILRSPAVDVMTPKVTMKSWFIPVFSTCVAGETIYATSTVEECVRYENRGDDQVCSGYRTVRLSTPRNQQVQVCAEWSGHDGDCRRYTTTTRRVPLTYDIGVYYAGGPESMYNQLAFTKTFTIPQCQ